MPRTLTLAVMLAGAATLSACVVAPPPHYGYAPAPTVVVRAPVAPPPPRVEVIPIQPYRDHVWIPGFWSWDGHRHFWTDGRWEAPRHGERWVERRWERDEHEGWRQRGGHWQRD